MGPVFYVTYSNSFYKCDEKIQSIIPPNKWFEPNTCRWKINVPSPYPPTIMRGGNREITIVVKIKPELHHTFVWDDPPEPVKGWDHLTQ